MPRNLGLVLSLDNKTWRKKNRNKKLTNSIPTLMSKLVKKYAFGPVFKFVGFVPAYPYVVCALKCSSEVLNLPNISNRIHSHTRLSMVHENECIRSKSFD